MSYRWVTDDKELSPCIIAIVHPWLFIQYYFKYFNSLFQCCYLRSLINLKQYEHKHP